MAEPAAPLPATLIAGFGGAAKAEVVASLLRQKPEGEEWALISSAPAPAAGTRGIWIEAVAPGCPCCTGLVPFSAGLTRLLRRLRDTRVKRLIIEGGAEGHIKSVARVLAATELAPYVALAGRIAVVNPAWIAEPGAFALAALRQLATEADRLIAGPWDAANAGARPAFAAFAASFTPAKTWIEADAVTPGFVFPER